MKVVILASDAYNYRKPLADGLYCNIKAMNQDVCVLYDGIHWLNNLNLIKVFFSDIFRLYKNFKSKRHLYLYRFFDLFTFWIRNANKIKEADCVVVVDNCPNVFYKKKMSRIEWLRKKYDKIVVNYDLHYLPNQGWFSKILKANPDNYGLERFDWYLTGSLVTEYALPKAIPQIYSYIGFDIKSGELYPEQKEFIALLDFPRKGYEKERELVKTVLEQTKTKYIELSGKYTRSEIREIYRKSSIYFISFRESFGLPVLETQLCGCKVFTPYAEWLPAHFIDKSVYEAGCGTLGKNFVVYQNDATLLTKKIQQTKLDFDARQVISNFRKDYPMYYEIDKLALQSFFQMIEKGLINSKSHLKYKDYNKMISLEDNVELR